MKYVRKWFEPRSDISCLKMIIWVTGVLRTAVGDRRFDDLCVSHLQSQVAMKMASAQVVETFSKEDGPLYPSANIFRPLPNMELYTHYG